MRTMSRDEKANHVLTVLCDGPLCSSALRNMIYHTGDYRVKSSAEITKEFKEILAELEDAKLIHSRPTKRGGGTEWYIAGCEVNNRISPWHKKLTEAPPVVPPATPAKELIDFAPASHMTPVEDEWTRLHADCVFIRVNQFGSLEMTRAATVPAESARERFLAQENAALKSQVEDYKQKYAKLVEAVRVIQEA